MRRRDLLAAASSTLAAGCLGSGQSNAQSRFAGEPCPQLTGETTCYHTQDGPQGLVLQPETERVEAPSEPLRFTLHNDTGTTVRPLLTFPTFARRVGGRWQRLPHQRQDSGGVAVIESGDTHEFVLLNGGYRDLPGADTVTIQRYGAGEYAYAVWLSDRDQGLLARVIVGGETLSLDPPGNVRTRRDGETLVVTHPDHENARRTVALTFAELSGTDDSLQIAPEVLVGRWDLRSVAFLRHQDVAAVEVRTVEDYFRRPVEWLEAAGIWEGSDRPYAIGDLTVRISQSRDRAET